MGGLEIGGGRRETGFAVSELITIKKNLEDKNYQCELFMLSDSLPDTLRNANQAATLVIRGGAKLFLGEDAAEKLLLEQRTVQYDEKFFDRGQTKNKRARHNIVFGSKASAHSEDYSKPTVVSFDALPCLDVVRTGLEKELGAKAAHLLAEGNHYFESKSGIGFHGDSERKIVVCLSLGATSTLRYAWRMPGTSNHYGEPIDIAVKHGDIYVMSEKATGYDWRMRSRVRVVHAAGAHAFK